MYCDTSEVYPVGLPNVRALAKSIIAVKRKPPSGPVTFQMATKSVFRLIRTHRLADVMVTEFPGNHFGLGWRRSPFYRVPPFEWGSIPVRFCRFRDAVIPARQFPGPQMPFWNMGTAFRPRMYMDDGLFIDLYIGYSKDQPTQTWEEIAKGFIPDQSTEGEKDALEWSWICARIFLRFSIDGESSGVSIPDRKRAGANVIFDALFDNCGSKSARLKNLATNTGYGRSL